MEKTEFSHQPMTETSSLLLSPDAHPDTSRDVGIDRPIEEEGNEWKNRLMNDCFDDGIDNYHNVDDSDARILNPPPAKRHKLLDKVGEGEATTPPSQQQITPDIASEAAIQTSMDVALEEGRKPSAGPSRSVRREHSTGSVSSDLSSLSGQPVEQDPGGKTGGLDRSVSPIPNMFPPEIPPAPPSTPASQVSTFSWDATATPLPFHTDVLNASSLEEQQLAAEGLPTPAPSRPSDGTTSGSKKAPSSLNEDFSDWAVGDRYQMMRLLGRGSYGEVAQAVDLLAGKPDAFVAIKRIQSPFDQEVDAIRLYREIFILRRMRGHQCIIQLVDVVQPPSDDLDDFHDLYLVFEYVDTDLYKLIMSPQYLTTEHIQTFAYQMLIALKYIHSSSVIHRDLKPANILLNEDCSLKICDFGLARMVDSTTMASSTKAADSEKKSPTPSLSEAPRLSLTRQLTKHVVTRWYRAPELILIQPYTSAVDIWSVGCILAELLSMQDGNVPSYQDRKPLFPGGTCYPLSGEGDKVGTDERLDQLTVIFNVIGTPSDEDIESIGKASKYIKSLGKVKGKNFHELFPASSPAAIDLLMQMLLFNPRRRITASEALEHEFFKNIRQAELEVDSDGPLRGPDFLESDSVDLGRLKQIIYDEVLWYRDNGPSTELSSSGDAAST